MALKEESLLKTGFLIRSFSLPNEIKSLVEIKNWNAIDEYFKKITNHDGMLFNFLKQFHDFDSIEFIISYRTSDNPDEEDGIWHDDGSRLMAFSLSLTLHAPNLGGKLSFRKKGAIQEEKIPTPKFGEMIIFLTGIYGFEHKTNAVLDGERLIIAGWCS